MHRDLTTTGHWDDAWSGDIRLRLPSPWVIATRNMQQLIRPRVRPGHRFLEVGCAPGKMLAWVADALGAQVSGLDYSERGIGQARRLFEALGLAADLRCEDIRQTSFASASFDVVVSAGVIEHFDDPREVVRSHLALVKPGGLALMTVPNYRGIYGTLQNYFDPENLRLHNLEIMTTEALTRLVSPGEAASARAYPFGRFSPWQVSFEKRLPVPLARGLAYAANAAGLLQPLEIRALAPMLVLEVVKPT